MAAGIYRYDFEYLLPPNIPASFEASYGEIRYYIEAKLDIPWAFDKEFIEEITVVRFNDLNLFPDLRNPIEEEEIRHFCCLFCQSGPLIMTVSLPHSGFAAGQTIPILIEYVNKSTTNVEQTWICLEQVIEYNR